MARTQADTGGRAALKNRTPQMTLVLVKVPEDSNRLDLNLYYGNINLLNQTSGEERLSLRSELFVVFQR